MTPATLSEAFAAAAAAHPAAAFSITSDERPATASLAEIVARGRVVGERLAGHGIRPGDVVAVMLPAWAEWLIACVAIAHAGAVLLPIISIYGARELGFILRQSKARLIVTPDRWRGTDYDDLLAGCGELPALRGHVMVGPHPAAGAIDWAVLEAPCAMALGAARLPDDLAMLVYTSGTTADPKGVCHSGRTLLAELDSLARARASRRDEVILSPWPPGHVAGACTMMRYLVQGVPLVALDRWDAGMAAALIEQHRVTWAAFTPYHLSGLLDAADRDGRDIASLADCMVGAAPVPPTLIARCAERGLTTYRCYGSSEHPTVTSGSPTDPISKRLATEGRPMWGSELRFVDDDGRDVRSGSEGEIATRGPDLFTGYLDLALDAAAFLPGGWYRSGDIGRLDEDGYLLITDRKKDVIIRGGENIASREVEEVLLCHPDIAEAAVVAAPDARMGEVVLAYIVVRAGAVVTLDAVRVHFRTAGVARQKTPEQLILVPELPRNATGKVLKHILRARVRNAET